MKTYFIADIASNHDGELERALKLIKMAAHSGANAVKFQSFKADTIVSDYGFRQLGKQSHQAKWDDSVYDTYKKYEVPFEWIPALSYEAKKLGLDFLTTPYDPDMVVNLMPYVDAWKIGSGDITYEHLIRRVDYHAKGNGTTVYLATGASTNDDITRAMEWLRGCNVVLMQCNTNYTNDISNFHFLNLNVIAEWVRFSQGVFGLSDHTQGNTAVLGAVALGARTIEKHFTVCAWENGPDHAFSMMPDQWERMVQKVRDLESMLGDGDKKVEGNEKETIILQRRAIRASWAIPKGCKIAQPDISYLRPCPPGALPPYQDVFVIGKTANRDILAGEYINLEDLV